ncbi:MAG TPA: M20/M25/M40 family metallo-hydrolase, partial [Pyrinomonadaceae bacterium]|nr:M20/M25/M40 family metallo-hydrolase [Pyrinomonadaceae bacterium]
GTGATDNGAGVAVAMEAARIIQALGLKPRRTIRVALWTGEEQGLLGSKAYVTEHFGEVPAASPTPTPNPAATSGTDSTVTMLPQVIRKPEYDKFDVYFNLDNGTGKIRGVYLQNNETIRPLFRQWLMPFRELGAATLSIANTGGTDHLSFDAIGLPGFQFIQDEIEYDTRTHHSNQDVFDRVQGDDMKQAATIMAAFVYDAAMRDEKVPRKMSVR